MIIIPLGIYILCNFTVAILAKKEFGKCMPVTMMACAFLLFFSQLFFHTYSIGFLVAEVMAFASIPVFIVKRKTVVFENFFSAGFFIFLAIAVFVLVWDYHRHFTIFDEFYHWGMMVKESMRLDRFYAVEESRLFIHKDYPPFQAMVELFVCRFAGYSEGKVSAALHLFVLSTCILPVSEDLLKNDMKNKRNAICALLIGFLLILLSLTIIFTMDGWTPRGVTSILADVPPAILFAYSFYLIFKNKTKSLLGIVALTMSNAAILMTKQAGIGFVIVLFFYGIIHELFNREENPKDSLKQISGYVFSVLLPAGCSFVWASYIKKLGITGQFGLGSINLHVFWEALTGKENGLIHDTIWKYILALFEKPIGSVQWMQVTYASSFLIVLVVLALLCYFGKDKVITKKMGIEIALSFFCLTVGYALVMMVLYAFCFNPSEMRSLASFERYMASYVLGEVLVLVFIGMHLIQKKFSVFNSVKKTLILTAVCMVALNATNMVYLVPQSFHQNRYEAVESEAKFVTDKTEENSSIYTIYDYSTANQQWYGAHQVLLLYYTEMRKYPVGIDAYHADWSNSDQVQAILDSISSCDYLYIRDCNEQVKEGLSLFCSGTIIEDNSIYLVKHEENGLLLEKKV